MKILSRFAALLAGDHAASAECLPPPSAANLPRRGVNPVRRDGGSLGPNQIAWCDENLTGFKEFRGAATRVAMLYEESKRVKSDPTTDIVA